MSDSLDPRDEQLTERLAALGRQPVSPAVQSQHLTAMSSVAPVRSFRTSLAGRLKVGAGVLAGFMLGASGLTAAGAMGPLQPIAAQVAHDVAKVDVPKGPKAKAEKAAKEKAAKARLKDGSIGTQRDWSNDGKGCADTGTAEQYAGNRGQYLKQERAKGADQLAAAKASTCGMPVGAEKDAEEPKAPEVEGDDESKGKSDDANGKKDAAPGQEDKGEPGDKAEGPKDEGDEPEAKPEGAGPGGEAGNSGLTPPEVTPPAQPTPDTPAPAAGDAATGDEV